MASVGWVVIDGVLQLSSLGLGMSNDVFLERDAANTLALRNGTNFENFNIYRTYTSAAVNQYLNIGYDNPNSRWVIADVRTGGGGGNSNMNISSTGDIRLLRGDGHGIIIASNEWQPDNDNTQDIGDATHRPKNVYVGTSLIQSGKTTTYNGVSTAGHGLSVIYAAARSTAQTAAVATVATFTPTADATVEVSANVLVTTSTTHTFNVECAYTDEGNTARTITLPFTLVAGSAIVNSVSNASGAVPYVGIPLHLRVKAATAVLIRTQAAGTYTTVTYNVDGVIRQLS